MRRIFHHWETWECYPAGFYRGHPPTGLSAGEAREQYRVFLSDSLRFNCAIERVFKEWPTSSEQFLSNEAINRIAWIGQSAMCIETGVSSKFRGGFKLLSPNQQQRANHVAQLALTKWTRGFDEQKNKPVSEDVEQPGLFS